MLASLLFAPVPTLIAVLISGSLAFIALRGKAAMTFFGCLLAFLGVGFLVADLLLVRHPGEYHA
jgi:hypothetical protein